MENLPFVVLKKLFEMMNPTDLINCSRVCRNWQAAYETMIVKPNRLFLHFDPFMPLNYQLYHTGEAVAKSDFLQIRNDLRFLGSDAARIHFANLKKLVIFPAYTDHEGPEFRRFLEYDKSLEYDSTEFSRFDFPEYLNHFESLEHFEIHYRPLWIEDAQIDLPKLRVLCFEDCEFAPAQGQITLNTPSLEVLGILTTCVEKRWSIVNFNILFPAQLRHLRTVNPGHNFKFPTEFTNLECLVIDRISEFGDLELFQQLRWFFHQLGDGFLESLPNLKFVFAGLNEVYWSQLNAEKVKFNREDLNILDHEQDSDFHYEDWRRHLQYEGQLSRWPEEFGIEFGKLANCRIPFRHFENYLPIRILSVRQVTNQPLLVQFLRNVKIKSLTLDYDFNLGQSFFEEIADFLTVDRLTSYASNWVNVSDFSVLRRMNFLDFKLYFDLLPRQLVRELLRKPSCLIMNFLHYLDFDEDLEEGREWPRFRSDSSHRIKRINNKFFCQSCFWASSRDANCSRDPIEGTVHHIENERSARNMTKEEAEKPFGLFGVYSEASCSLPKSL